jgi:hypothetical protein
MVSQTPKQRQAMLNIMNKDFWSDRMGAEIGFGAIWVCTM